MKKHIEKHILIVLTVMILIACFVSCHTKKKQQSRMLLLLECNGELFEFKEKDGDVHIWSESIIIQWTEDGCVLSYTDEKGNVVDKKIEKHEDTEIRVFAAHMMIPVNIYLCDEDELIPKGWNEMVQEKLRIEEWRAVYGSYDNYKSSRADKHEMDIIQNALAAAGIELTGVYWYETFLESTWENADDFLIMEAYAEKGQWNCLTLLDEKGNMIQIYGDDQFLDAVYYNDELYYGGGIQ